ncbi:MAG: ribosome maturation factor RimM [Acidimicrobiales bacterium]
MLLEVGRVTRPHGIRGQVIVELTSNREERMAPGTRLSASSGELEIRRSSPAGPSRGRWIVAFAGIDTREAAEALRGTVLSAEAIDDPEALWVHDLIGAEVVDQTGASHGQVRSVQANPASDLLVLEDGSLVPLRFVTSLQARRVLVEVPPGLFEL